MACLRSFISPIRALSSTSHSIALSKNPVFGNLGLLKSWAKNLQTISPLYSQKIELMSMMHKKIAQNLNPSGRKIFVGSFLGLSAVTAVMCNQPIVAHAMDDHYADLGGPSGFLKDDLNTFWSLARKFQTPIVLLVTVWLGWRHPITLAINVVLLLFCTNPSPLSIYMFIEQAYGMWMLKMDRVPHSNKDMLRQRDMRQDPSPLKTKLLYVKNVKVQDYKVLCFAEVELRDVKLDVIGILGGWWVYQAARV